MTSDGDDLEGLLRIVQHGIVAAHNAMVAEVAMPNEEERRQARRDRLGAQLNMLAAAQRAFRLGVEAPRPWLLAESVAEVEKRCGFVPGTYARAVGRPSEALAVLVEQDVELAIRVTRAQLAAEDGPVDRAFTAAVLRICCATVIGALVGAPLGALAAHESIVSKMAEAAVVVGLGTTTAEIIQPISVQVTREPTAPPDIASYHLATNAARNVHDVTPRPNPPEGPVPVHRTPPDDSVTAVDAPAPPPEPDDDSPWRRPVRPPVDEPVRRPFGDPGSF